MRLPRTALALLALAGPGLVLTLALAGPGLVLTLALAGPGLVLAQDHPLAAGSEGVPVPKKKKHVQPVYPPEALAQGVRGIVILDLVIDEDGRVAETFIIRSIPGLDEAALVAARQWRYEPVEVDGRPVRVRLTVPITFALRLPEMSRDRGIPELRQGVNPPWPSDGRGGGLAVADVTLEPDGRIRLARILEGDEPWSTALLQALRTWRFRAPPDDVTVSFRVAADFVPEKENGRVELRLTGLRETSLLDSPSASPAVASAATMPVAADEPAESGTSDAPEPETSGPPAAATGEADSPPEGPDRPVEGPAAPAAGPPPAGPDVPSTEAEAPQMADAGVPPSVGPASLPEGAEPAAPGPQDPPPSEPGPTGEAPVPGPVTASPPTPPAPTPSGAPPVTADATQTADVGAPATAVAPPPVEVLSVAPPPPPPENGISAIRGVELEPGVPDLTRGRRPVSPPFARMQGASGEVKVEFSVGAGGLTAVQRVDGPEVFQPAARQAVESWIFRRTRADRAYLVAVFTYEDDLASAVVRPQPQR